MSSKHLAIAIACFLLIAVTLPRVAHLGQFITADEPRWQANVSGFITKLSLGRLDSLVQQPHPGLTQQWLAAPTIFSGSWATRKLPLAIWHSVIVLLTGYVFWRLHGKVAGLLSVLLLAINPLLVAHSRIYAMDALLAEFTFFALSLLLLWQKTQAPRYLIFAGLAAAAAFWSKQPGLILILFSFLFIFWQELKRGSPPLRAVLPLSEGELEGVPRGAIRPVGRASPKAGGSAINSAAIFLAAIIIISLLILPTLLIDPRDVLGDLTEFYRSDEYSHVHQYGRFYYLETMIFFSTPLHLAALLILPFTYQKLSPDHRRTIITLLLFIILYTFAMSLGAKKGYRYLLPVFPLLDLIAAITVTRVSGVSPPLGGGVRGGVQWLKLLLPKRSPLFLLGVFLILLQATNLYRLHPYELAYINPLTRPLFNQRQLGWGEGLDLAAAYLNQKSHASQLKVASYYETQFRSFFQGETIPLHQWDEGNPDYAVLYRAMLGRSPESWETDVLQQFKPQTPEKIITLNNLEYVWIYSLIHPPVVPNLPGDQGPKLFPIVSFLKPVI